MAAEYTANALQSVALNAPIVFENSIPCNKGFIYHEDGTGIFVLRGITDKCFATYRVTFNGNVQIPEGGTAGPVAIAININGETRPASLAIYTPTAAETFGNLTSTTIVKIPRGCCFTASVDSVPATADPTATPAPVIGVANANLVITKIGG